MLGFYGKLASRGDFATRDLPHSFIQPWDTWLAAGLHASQQQSVRKTVMPAANRRALSLTVAGFSCADGRMRHSMCKNPDLGDWASVPCPNV